MVALQKTINEQITFCKINIVFSSKNKLKNVFSLKDKLPRDLKSLVIYKYTCSDCNINHIGKSTRHFIVRYSEHLGISKLTNKKLPYNNKTSHMQTLVLQNVLT